MKSYEFITESQDDQKIASQLNALSDREVILALNSLTGNLNESDFPKDSKRRDWETYVKNLSLKEKEALVKQLQKEAKERDLNANLNDVEPEPETEGKPANWGGIKKTLAAVLVILAIKAGGDYINQNAPEPEKDDATRRYEAGEAYRTGKPIPPNVSSAEYTNNYFGGTYKRVSLIYEWKKLSFNTMEADFNVSNQNDFAVKDVKIKCTHYSESGTQIDSNTRTVYKVFPRGSQISIPSFNMGFIHSQVAKSFCEIIDWDKVK